ncbi:hypothetical protein ACX9R5_08305 [Rathayibacter sp. CAU 1779]
MTGLTGTMLLIAIPIVVVMVGIVALVVVLVVRMSRNPSTRAVQPGSPAAFGNGSWNAHVRRDGHLDPLSGFGTLTLGNGWLTFAPDDGTVQGWSVPSVSFGVWSNFVLANSDLGIDSQPTGRLQLTVSHEHINRMSQNDFKMLRQRDTAAEFVQAMRAAGATILG